MALQTLLNQFKADLPSEPEGFQNIETLLALGREEVRQALFLLDTLDIVDLLLKYFTVERGRLRLASVIQSPEYFLSELLDVDPRPEWVERLFVPLLGLLYRAMSDMDPSEAETAFFDFCTPIGETFTPAEPFLMGNPDKSANQLECPPHSVSLSPFWVSKTEVTQGLFWQVTGTNPSKSIGMSRPVESVSWLDAVSFCNALSQWGHLEPAYSIDGEDVRWIEGSQGYRLPTEAEWEFVAQSGRNTSALQAQAWWTREWEGEPQAVMQLEANTNGIFDLFGNVSELCWDWFGRYTEGPKNNPRGPTRGQSKVHRGGGWSSAERQLMMHARASISPSIAVPSIGFRVFRSL